MCGSASQPTTIISDFGTIRRKRCCLNRPNALIAVLLSYLFVGICTAQENPQDWIHPRDCVIYAWLPGEKEQWEERETGLKGELAKLKDEFTAWLSANREPSEMLFEATLLVLRSATTWRQHFSCRGLTT
jgi:hypothetical protein